MKKMKIAIIYGGQSSEHDISCISAENVVQAMDLDKYEILLVEISKKGKWFERMDGFHGPLKRDLSFDEIKVDVAFPVLHGPYGEDGTIQGVFKMLGIPCVGADILGSAIGMDKDVMKRLCRDAGIPIAKFMTKLRSQIKDLSFQQVVDALGLPFFVKPANAGSSLGISKVKQAEEFQDKVALALQYDHKIIFEEYIMGREIECAVLGNEEPRVALPGEIIPKHEFYSYDAKYIDPEGARLEIPAILAPELQLKIQTLAIQVYQTLVCEGMARVDFFLKLDGTCILNEINTIPGFTSISMYPKMWEATGVSYSQLIDELIHLAYARKRLT